jgi:hypothetical protein
MVAHCWISGVFAPDLLASFHIHVTPFRAFWPSYFYSCHDWLLPQLGHM